MANLLFLPHRSLLAWISCRISPGELVCQVKAGTWHPPASIADLSVPPGTRLRVVEAGRVLLLFPASPVPVHSPWRGMKLSQEERRILALHARGLNSSQIACLLGRSPRWVRYQLHRFRELLGQAPQRRITRHQSGEK